MKHLTNHSPLIITISVIRFVYCCSDVRVHKGHTFIGNVNIVDLYFYANILYKLFEARMEIFNPATEPIASANFGTR